MVIETPLWSQSIPEMCNLSISEGDSGSGEIAHYAVANIDLLGQESKLLKYTFIPGDNDPEKRKDFTHLASNSIKAVKQLRISFNTFYDAFNNKGHIDHNIPNGNAKHIDIKCQYLTDGILFYARLLEPSNKYPVNNMYGMIGAAGYLCLSGLYLKNPVRGGIDVGWASNVWKDEIYGGAIARAHILEKEIAQYPRIVVNHELTHYLSIMAHPMPDNNNLPNIIMSNQCAQLMSNDFDGNTIVDYLGEGFKGIINTKDYKKLISGAYKYILEVIAECNKEPDKRECRKLLPRYIILKNYFDVRLELWGLSPT